MKFKTYDELSKEVNKSYKKTEDVRQTVSKTDASIDEVWDMLGYKDYFDFEKVEL